MSARRGQLTSFSFASSLLVAVEDFRMSFDFVTECFDERRLSSFRRLLLMDDAPSVGVLAPLFDLDSLPS